MATAFLEFIQDHIGGFLKFPFNTAVSNAEVVEISPFSVEFAVTPVGASVTYYVTVFQTCCFSDPVSPFRTTILFSWKNKTGTAQYAYDPTDHKWRLAYVSKVDPSQCFVPDAEIEPDDWENAWVVAGLPVSEQSMTFVPEDDTCKTIEVCPAPGVYVYVTAIGLIGFSPIKIKDQEGPCPPDFIGDVTSEVLAIVADAVLARLGIPADVTFDNDAHKFIVSIEGFPLLEGRVKCCPPVCPPGYTYQDGICVPPEPQCPEGYEWDGEKCVSPDQPDNPCPEGWSYA